MEPEFPTPAPGVRQDDANPALSPSPTVSLETAASDTQPDTPHPDNLTWLFLGPNGLRAGTSVALFAILLYTLAAFFGTILSFVVEGLLNRTLTSGTATGMVLGEAPWVAALATSAAIMALLDHRRLLDYNLAGRHRFSHFISGLAAGFLALSSLVGVMAWGGWLHFGQVSLHGQAVGKYAVLWAVGFLFVGLTEEGTFRCYLQFTLTRGINFWWALATIAAVCLDLLIRSKGHGVWGIYAFALLGLFPCLWLHLKNTPRSGFWHAAWLGSTLFGFVHTFNDGENWIGIFAAAAIGFVFCVSVRVTGAAWWAIGCHSAWDWAETYFYGTPDSGYVSKGHFLATSVTGSTLWSGGTDGPEGSLLVLPIILLLLAAVLAFYGRQRRAHDLSAILKSTSLSPSVGHAK
jgi:hypothetical protein